ncbi:hypothetical protein EIP91_012294 [Steccherinum ochraceum]|uniref:Uncharacterized protein n=1 Tax=Steccherinum ochraceum TaxID=92696 RepID=A0A4R0RGK1_9APHY|nr:hypothetical protein EIP91_012294 [Steccherinum ochraceum]
MTLAMIVEGGAAAHCSSSGDSRHTTILSLSVEIYEHVVKIDETAGDALEDAASAARLAQAARDLLHSLDSDVVEDHDGLRLEIEVPPFGFNEDAHIAAFDEDIDKALEGYSLENTVDWDTYDPYTDPWSLISDSNALDIEYEEPELAGDDNTSIATVLDGSQLATH